MVFRYFLYHVNEASIDVTIFSQTLDVQDNNIVIVFYRVRIVENYRVQKFAETNLNNYLVCNYSISIHVEKI